MVKPIRDNNETHKAMNKHLVQKLGKDYNDYLNEDELVHILKPIIWFIIVMIK